MIFGAGISVAFEDAFQEDYIWSGPAVGFVDFDSYCSTTLFAAETSTTLTVTTLNAHCTHSLKALEM